MELEAKIEEIAQKVMKNYCPDNIPAPEDPEILCDWDKCQVCYTDAILAAVAESGYVLVEETPQDKLAHDLLITMMAEWIAIDHDETKNQAGKYLEEAQELYDYLFLIGFRNDRDTESGYVKVAKNQTPPTSLREQYGNLTSRYMEIAQQEMLTLVPCPDQPGYVETWVKVRMPEERAKKIREGK